jgi:RND family efflux transporter MFP subunit
MDEPAIQPSKPEWALTRRELKKRALLAAGIQPARFPWMWAGAAVVVVGLAVFVLPQFLAPQASTPTETAAPAADVVKRLLTIDVATAAPATLSETLKATGSLAPRRSISIASQVNGTLKSVAVRIGDSVKAGDVLATVDVETSQIQLSQQRSTAAATRAQLAQAENQLERTLRLADSGLTPSATVESEKASIEALKANLSALEAQVEAAELVIRNATVTAPFDGIVAARSIEPGQLITSGAALFNLVDLSMMEMTAYVPVSASPKLSPGQGVSLTVEGLPGQTFAATVEGVSPVAAQGTRTVPVLISVPNPGGQLRGGMFASGRITIEEAPAALAVPEAAVRQDAEGRHVLKIVDGALVRQPIEIARNWSSSRMAQLSSGLAAGDTYVSGKLDDLAAGMRVTVVEN